MGQQQRLAAKRIKTSCKLVLGAGASGRYMSPGADARRVAASRGSVKRAQPFSPWRRDLREGLLTDELDIRRKRAAYRAHHRGTKEMDVIVGRYADAHLGRMTGGALDEFEAFLAIADPVIEAWVFGKENAHDGAFARLVEDIRAFHGLAAGTDAEKR